MNSVKAYLVTMLLLVGRFFKKSAGDRWVAGAAFGVSIAGLGATQLLALLGISAVTHSSGAIILTGAGGYVAGTYGLAMLVFLVTAPLAIALYLVVIAVGLIVLVKQKLKS